MAEIHEQRDQIIEQLEGLNEKMRVQNSVRHTFVRGVIYGVGVFIGSAIVATIIFSILRSLVGDTGWVHDIFQGATNQ